MIYSWLSFHANIFQGESVSLQITDHSYEKRPISIQVNAPLYRTECITTVDCSFIEKHKNRSIIEKNESALNDNRRRRVASRLFKSVIDTFLRRLATARLLLFAHRNHCRDFLHSSEKCFHGVECIIAIRRQERQYVHRSFLLREKIYR